jgi:LacI family transcriptional regulator
MTARSTLREVSELAEVSVATASLVLSGKAGNRFTEETALRVRQAADKLGYRTNRLARSLRQQSTRVLGLLSIEVATTPYAGAMVEGMRSAARSRDYDLLFNEVTFSKESISAGLELMSDHRVDGVIIASYYHRGIELPDNLPKNVVLADAFSKKIKTDSFVPDEENSFMQVLDLIGQSGHKEVALISDGRDYPAVKGRKFAFEKAAKKYGWNNFEENMMLVAADAETEMGYNSFNLLYGRNPKITAVAAYNDQIAMGVYEAAREHGLSIPGDLSVVGFDNLELISGALRPGLTTVELPHFEMGRLAAERLIERVESEDELPPEKVAIVGDIYVRGSISIPRTSVSRKVTRIH